MRRAGKGRLEIPGAQWWVRKLVVLSKKGRPSLYHHHHFAKYTSFFHQSGAGYDQCNIPDCTKAGIHVSNVPTAVDAATADTAIFLMLGALRMFAAPLMNLRKGEFRGKTPPPLGHDPEGKMVGIVGMGGIGRDFKKKAEALGMKVQYHNRSRLSDEMNGGAKYVGLEELLGTSDVISLNVPLNVSLRLLLRETLSYCLYSTTTFPGTTRPLLLFD